MRNRSLLPVTSQHKIISFEKDKISVNSNNNHGRHVYLNLNLKDFGRKCILNLYFVKFKHHAHNFTLK